jgi:ComF family protein
MDKVNNCLKIIQQILFPPLCLLCDAPVSDHPDRTGMDLCAECSADLPYMMHACAGCALPLPPKQGPGPDQVEASLCGRCLQQRPAFDAVKAVFHYQAPVDALILGLKFNGRLSHARLLGQLMSRRLSASGFERPDLLLPVPLHRRRLRERGFNQSMELARHISRGLAVPVEPDVCHRQRDTATQSSLPARDRRRNIRNAFVCQRPLQGQHVVVIDDVMTTGSTANELALALRRAGARRVDIWVCARVVI